MNKAFVFAILLLVAGSLTSLGACPAGSDKSGDDTAKPTIRQ